MKLHIADWPEAETRVMPLRMAVFVDEQGVPADMERDADDPLSRHAWIEDDDGTVIATGRLLPDGHVGRMAVARAQRASGLGSCVLMALIEEAMARGLDALVLHAQVHAAPFYARFGFEAEGPVFLEAGIEHQRMRRRLKR